MREYLFYINIIYMSQSDYIKYKKDYTRLAVDASLNFPPVLSSQDYTNYKGFVLENTVIPTVSSQKSNKTKMIYNIIQDPNNQVVFDMNKNKTQLENMGTSLKVCPSFLMCNKTDSRLNKIPLSSVYFTPTPQPINWQEKKGVRDIKIDNLINTSNPRWKSWSSQFPSAVKRALHKEPLKDSPYTTNFCKCITKNLHNNVCNCKKPL